MEAIRNTVSSVMGLFEAMSATPCPRKNSSRPLRTTPSANPTAGLRLRISSTWSSYRALDLGHGATGHAHVGLPWRKAVRSLRPITAMVPTTTAPSTHRLGFVVAGRLWADSGITSKWTDSAE